MLFIRTLIISVLILLNLVYSSVLYKDKCPNQDWSRLDEETCIHLSKLQMNFEQSKNYCELKFNSNRLTILNRTKQNLVLNYLNNLDFKVWIGLNRVKLKNGQSVLLWDTEFEKYNLLNKLDQSNDLNDKSNSNQNSNETNHNSELGNNLKFSHHLNRLNSNIIHNHTKKGLIDLISHNDSQNNTNSSYLTQKLISSRSILQFDNRFRINQVDSHFFISNQTDKWRMSFSPSNKFYTICELSTNRGNLHDKCKSNWQSIGQNSRKCIRFVQLAKPSMINEIKNFCKDEFQKTSYGEDETIEIFENSNKNSNENSNKNLNIDIFNLNTVEELNYLVKLLEFESNQLRNAPWLIFSNNLTSLDHLFRHKPLINNSCYQIIPNEMIEKRLKRNIRLDREKIKKYQNVENRIEYEIDKQKIGLNEMKERTNSELLSFSFVKKVSVIKKDKNGNFKRTNKRNRDRVEHYEYSVDKDKNNNFSKNSNENLNKRKERELDIVNFVKERSMLVESHFIHEFNCNALVEYVICSYIETNDDKTDKTVLEKGNAFETSAAVELMKQQRTVENNETSTEIEFHTNRIGHQRSLWKSSSGDESLMSNRQTNLISANLSHLDCRDKVDTNEVNLTVKNNYLSTFDLLTKIQLAFIPVYILFFIYFCLRLNPAQNTRNLQASVSSTHVHFDNYDGTLKFEQFDY